MVVATPSHTKVKQVIEDVKHEASVLNKTRPVPTIDHVRKEGMVMLILLVHI